MAAATTTHDLDEREPPTQRSGRVADPIERAKALLVSRGFTVIDPPLLADAEKRSRWIEVWDDAHKKCLRMHFVFSLDHNGKPFHVAFQPDWRALAYALDFDPYDSATEEKLTEAAMRAWEKSERIPV